MPSKLATELTHRSISSGNPTGLHNRSALHQHHPHAGDGRRAEGQFRPSGHADGFGAGGLHAVAEFSAVRSRRSDLAQSRPLRVVQRPRLDAALCDAASRGVKAVECQIRTSRRTGGVARRYQAISPARQQCPGPSGISPHLGRRNDHRPARPGLRQQRRHGDRRRVGWRSTSTGRISRCSTTTFTRVRRWRHDGRRIERSGFAGGPSDAWQSLLDSTTATA